MDDFIKSRHKSEPKHFKIVNENNKKGSHYQILGGFPCYLNLNIFWQPVWRETQAKMANHLNATAKSQGYEYTRKWVYLPYGLHVGQKKITPREV